MPVGPSLQFQSSVLLAACLGGGNPLVATDPSGDPGLHPDTAFHFGLEHLVANLLRAADAVAGRLSGSDLRSGEAQLERYVCEARAKLGVLVYHDVEHKHLPVGPPGSIVIRILLIDLIAQFGTRNLAAVIAAAAVHGGPAAP